MKHNKVDKENNEQNKRRNMWKLILSDFLYLITLGYLEKKHHKLRMIILNLIIPIILAIITSLLTIKLLV